MVRARRVRAHLHFVVGIVILTRRTTVPGTSFAMDSVRISFGRGRDGGRGSSGNGGGGGGSSGGFIIGRRHGGVQRQRRTVFGARYSRLRTGHGTAGIPR